MVKPSRPAWAEPLRTENPPDSLACTREQFTEWEPPIQEACGMVPQYGCRVDW